MKAALRQSTARVTQRAELSAELILEAIRRQVQVCAYGDIRSLFDRRGNHRPIHTLTRDEADLIGSYEVILKNAKTGDGKTDEVLKVKLKDVAKFVEMGAKYFGLLQERVEVSGDAELIAALHAARARAAQANKSRRLTASAQDATMVTPLGK